MKLLFALLLALLSACRITEPTAGPVSSDPYVVYNALLKATTVGPKTKLLVLLDSTARLELGGAPSPEYLAHYFRRNMPQAGRVLIHRFIHANGSSIRLEGRFALSVETALVSQEALDALFLQAGGDWSLFYARFPGSGGYVELSRAAVYGSQALVYLGMRCDLLCGRGAYYLLENVNGEWQVRSELFAWIS